MWDAPRWPSHDRGGLTAMTSRILTEDSVVGHLGRRGILDAAIPAEVVRLAGGISAATFRVTTAEGAYVVKQPLPFLAVSQRWPASQSRADVEAAAIRRLQSITPQSVPHLLDYDGEEHVLVLSAAPVEWREWRQLLLGGDVDATVAAGLGRTLAFWHAATGPGTADLDEFASLEGFEQLRGRPYYQVAAGRRSDLAEPILACLDELVDRRTCLVHGDFSPKNVLVGPEAVWVLDFEVAHIGNPIFDLAFMLHHLVMKGVHNPEAAPALLAGAHAFTDAYACSGGDRIDEAALLRHVGALLLARVYGQSVTSYLTPRDSDRVSTLGTAALRDTLEELADLWPFTKG
jgi:aminoglycoside phosphotransferase (APT) family kinase protein